MSFSFRKSKKIGPFRVGVSKSGLSLSAGVKGARIGANSKGVYTTASIPKTGISNTQYLSRNKKVQADAAEPVVTNGKPPCPQCGSYKTIKIKALTAAIGFVLMVGGVFFFFLVFPLVLVPIGLVMMIAAPFLNGKKWMCNACHCKFETQ